MLIVKIANGVISPRAVVVVAQNAPEGRKVSRGWRTVGKSEATTYLFT